MLRGQIPDKYTEFGQPILGVNLRDTLHTLHTNECALMQNCFYDGGVRPIPGTRYLTESALAGATRIRGGHRAYWATAGRALRRLVAYSSTVSDISDLGAETVLTSSLTADLDTYFTTWSITDKVYIVNGTDTLYSYDGTSFAAVTGTAIPVVTGGAVVPVLDRLLGITANGIERTDPRSDSVWSSNSSWATFRGVRPGKFTALHPLSLKEGGVVYAGAIAFQANAHYIITGTNYGADVTAASPPTSLDTSIQLLDPTIGTSSPRGVCNVPGIGLFWVTSDLNIYHLPAGSLSGYFVGDKIRSRWLTTGLENANLDALDQIQLIYHDKKLIVRFPDGSSTYCNREFWLDLRYHLSAIDPKPVWYGPHTVTSIGVLWNENQSGELALMGGEGNATNGAYVYKAYQDDIASHTVGTDTSLPTLNYQTYHIGNMGGSTLKYVQRIRLTAQVGSAVPFVGVTDLNALGALSGRVTLYDS